MKYNQNHLSLAVRLALGVGFITTAGLVQAQQTSGDAATTRRSSRRKPETSKAENLKAVVVTGSLIRRVDIETASPVVTLDRAIITQRHPTLGNVLQQLPSVSGVATNPQNNSNGGGVASPSLEGGDGASRVSLRGLGTNRTLVLVDGQRLINADFNMIPQSMIERTDVLAEGASTVYGSDAIGGVVNFILRKDFSGVELERTKASPATATPNARREADRRQVRGQLQHRRRPGLEQIRPPPRHLPPVLEQRCTCPAVWSTRVVPAHSERQDPDPRVVAGQYGCKSRTRSGTAKVTLAQGTGGAKGITAAQRRLGRVQLRRNPTTSRPSRSVQRFRPG